MLAGALLLVGATFARCEPADLILRHGKVFLGSGRYAESLAVAGDRVAAVGTDADVMTLQGPRTRIIELGGRAVTPGFHDANARFFKGAELFEQLDLGGSGSLEDVQARVSSYAASHPDDPWIIGRGWDAARLQDGKLPTRADLDAAVSTRPVILSDASGGRAWLNSLALERAGITARSPNFNGGEIVRDSAGRPTGILAGESVGMATRAIPPTAQSRRLAALRGALAEASRLGVTSFDSMPGAGEPRLEDRIALWKAFVSSGGACARLFLYGDIEDPSGALKQRSAARALARVKVSVVGVGGDVDGDLRDRSAALLEPYFDESGRGQPRYLALRLDLLVRAAHKQGLQVALQTAGDRAARLALDACEKSGRRAREDERVLPEFPCRLERLEVLSPQDLPRLKTLSAAAELQFDRLVFDDAESNFFPNRLGDRARWTLPAKSLEDAGVTVAFGSGWPDARLDPRRALFAATSRQSLDGKPAQGWFSQERVSLESAVEHYTLDPARLIGLEDELGSIRPGKLADLVVFSDDLFARSGAALLEAGVDLTIFDGKIVFAK